MDGPHDGRANENAEDQKALEPDPRIFHVIPPEDSYRPFRVRQNSLLPVIAVVIAFGTPRTRRVLPPVR